MLKIIHILILKKKLNWSEEVFIINKIKNTVPWTYVIDDLNDEEIIGSFYEKFFMEVFPKPYKPFSGDINIKVGLSNYATKSDIKNISLVDTSSFALKTNLVNLKAETDKLDIDKLVLVPLYLSKLSDVVKNDVVKKDMFDKLVT